MSGPGAASVIVLFFGVVLAAGAGIMAALIMHAEMVHHVDERRAWREAVRAGVFAFLVFMVLTLVVVAAVPYLF